MAAVDHAGVKARRVHAALASGSVTRAADVLEQEPLLSWTPELHAELADLHPAGAELPPAPEEAPPPAAIARHHGHGCYVQPVRRQGTKLPSQARFAAWGASLEYIQKSKMELFGTESGMTYEHITAAVTGREDAIRAPLTLVNLVLSGSLPHCTEFTGNRLITIS